MRINWKETKIILQRQFSNQEKIQILPEQWQWRIDLSNAVLQGVDLWGAYLQGADLRDAYLRGADLRGADLRDAVLRGADLRGAVLWGADLRGADLRGAKLNYEDHSLMAEILKRAAGDNLEKLKIAGLVAIKTNWCWEEFLAIDDPLKDWALETLAQAHVKGDNAPNDVIMKLVNRNEN